MIAGVGGDEALRRVESLAGRERALEFADGDGVAFLLNYLAYLDQGCQEDEMPPGGLAYRAKVPWQRTLAERAQASCPTLRPESPED